ncbi:YlbL family protein [Timonella senegalensis]|uniref:YlbL family protein n=1 Tax=Timonella senegalensis TaxID=1465825 RepID=UPI0028A9CE31|nr:S16 family serine protease [Timonella senegalensis]
MYLVKFRNEEREPSRQRSRTLTISAIVTFLVVGGLLVIPAPYVVKSPGPTKDVLGLVNSKDLIQIENADVFPTTGQLRLTTVGVSGGPGFDVNFAQVIRGWLDPERAVFPVATVFPPDATSEQVQTQNQAEMVSSQENATYAALTELGYDVPTTLNVGFLLDDSPAKGKINEGDVLVSLDGSALNSYNGLIDTLNAIKPGTSITLGYTRDGKEGEATITTAPNEDKSGSRLGIALDPEFDFPVDVNITIPNIGGPSAGTMLALGIMDKLTEPDEANGAIIAGTGTMDTLGQVGAIGGIQQKLWGAKRDGATYFLAPESNCNEVVGHVPDGLQVVAVETLEDAWTAVKAIGGGQTDSLPTCS